MKRLLEWRIIGCPKCHLLQIVRNDRKYRRCPRCGYSIKLDFTKIRTWFKSQKQSDVVYALQKLKLRQAQHKGGGTFERLRLKGDE